MNNEANKLLPELRFPEFKDDGEWEEKTLDEVATILKGKGISKSDIVKEGSLPCIRYGELYTYYSETIRDIKSYTNLNADDLVLSQANDVIIPASGETQIDIATASCVLENGIALGGDLNIIRTKVNGVFLSYYLNNARKKDIAQLAQGISVVHLYPNQLKTLVLNIPKSKEQQKIASFLSSLDEVIAAHSQQLEALKDHKKSLMQNLFPQEGETVPKWRFPEFLEDGDWVNVSVEKLIQENILFAPKDGNHGNIHPKSSDYVKTGIPFIMASDLKNGKVDFSKCAYLKKEQADALQKGFSKSGDVLLTHKGTVGEVALLGDLDFPYIMLTPQVTYYRIKDKSKFSNGYLAAFFSSLLFQKSLFNVSGGGTRAYVGITEQQKLEIVYPNSIEEQQNIASCFSSLDSLITAQMEKIEQLKLHKKGLMQGLFPKAVD